ncbi:MAG: hypothetical protein CVT79_03465 [Alphaproteobacteria bacterium HGW-Alphaproteobacteria-18]|nr:MAG: hypothetical protein CVT79_03465 [Alphaproteobacteria bacterium HGW-Alphaproteobacteria-18]
MSDAVFSQLPRFDAISGPRPADWLRAMTKSDLHAPSGQAPPEAAETSLAPAPAKAEPSVVRPIPQETAALQTTVSNLAKLMERVEVESRQQTVETIRTLAGQLFPELSRRFLAEEIGRHLPGLIPAAVPVVDIRAEPGLAAQLLEMISRHPSLEGRCNVVSQEGQGAGHAEVTWRTGGVTFDFESLLAACLNDIGSTYKPNTEYK